MIVNDTYTKPITAQIASLPGKNYKWTLLILLWLAFFLHQADRQIYGVVLPLIKRDLGLSDSQLGLIASTLFWTYGIFVPVAGFMGDIFSRKKIIVFCLLFWSVATMSTGLCVTVLQFILIRGVATGGGEAFYAPSANALLSTHHTTSRSFALSIHQTAVYIGITASGLIAGYIGEQYGWRNAFYLFGSLGVVMTLIISRRVATDVPSVKERVSFSSVFQAAKAIYVKPTAWLLTAAFACMVFVTAGYQTWVPTLLVDKFGLSLTNAGFSSLFYHHVGAFAGVLIGGRLSDAMARKNPKGRLLIQALALLLASPFIFWVGFADSPATVYLAMGIFGIFRGIYDSNIFASLYEVVHPERRSTGTGLMLMFAFLAGAFSPYIMGIMKPTYGLSFCLSWLSLFYTLGAILIGVALIFFFKKDKLSQ